MVSIASRVVDDLETSLEALTLSALAKTLMRVERSSQAGE